MALSNDQITLMRMHLSDTDPENEIFSVTELNLFFSQGGGNFAKGMVFAFMALLGNKAYQVTYKANQSSENLSDISKHLRDLKADWEAEAQKGGGRQLQIVGMKSVPRKKRDRPGGGW